MPNLELARHNLNWIIQQIEIRDLEEKKRLAEEGVFLDGEIGYVYHLKKVLELLE